MSDYAKTTDFTAKDALNTGDPLKIIKGSYYDTEFDNIATAITSKLDSNDYASTEEAQAEAATDKVLSPSHLADWSDDNAGIIGDLQALADPAAHVLLGFDNTANVGKAFTAATGLVINATTVGLSFLGLEALTDPGADRILFWDDSESAFKWLSLSALTITTTSLAVDAGTTSAAGKLELATDAEVNTGTDTARAITAASLAQATTVTRILRAVKTSDQSKTSDDTLANDDDLTVTVVSGKYYAVKALIRITSNATPDFKWAFSAPGSTTEGFWHSQFGFHGNNGNTHYNGGVFETGQTLAIAGATENLFVVEGVYKAAGSGTFAFQWAQGTSDAGATVVKEASTLELTEIG